MKANLQCVLLSVFLIIALVSTGRMLYQVQIISYSSYLHDQVLQLQQKSELLKQEKENIIQEIETRKFACREAEKLKTNDNNQAFEKLSTKWKCYRREDQSEICDYDNICYDGKNIIFLDPTLPSHREMYLYPLTGREANIEIDWTYYHPYPYPVPTSEYVPYSSLWKNNVFKVNPKNLLQIADTIEELDGGVYFGVYDEQQFSVYNALLSSTNLWEAKILNETLGSDYKLPPQDYVILPRMHFEDQWEHVLYNTFTQPQTKYLFRSWFQANFELTDKKIPKHVPEPRKNNHVGVSKNNLVCARNAVIISKNLNFFSGIESSIRFRKEFFKNAELPFSVKGIQSWRTAEKFFSERVIIDNRAHNIENFKQIEDLVRFYGLNPILLSSGDDKLTFEQETKLINGGDVYIVAHGDDVANSIVLKPRSSLIEIFPYGMYSPKYSKISNNLEINYMKIVSWVKGSKNGCGRNLFTPIYKLECHNVSSLALSESCRTWNMNSCVTAPIYDIEMALINAYDILGVNLNTRVSEMFTFKRVALTTKFNDYHSNE